MKKLDQFVINYNNEFLNLLQIDKITQLKIKKLFHLIINIKKNKKKIIENRQGYKIADIDDILKEN